MAEPIFDHERLDVYRLSIEYVAFSYYLANTLAGSNRHARDQWLRAAFEDEYEYRDAEYEYEPCTET